jgi:hypothetical protein
LEARSIANDEAPIRRIVLPSFLTKAAKGAQTGMGGISLYVATAYLSATAACVASTQRLSHGATGLRTSGAFEKQDF